MAPNLAGSGARRARSKSTKTNPRDGRWVWLCKDDDSCSPFGSFEDCVNEIDLSLHTVLVTQLVRDAR